MKEDSPLETRAPPWPRCGASAAIFRNETVLLIERGKGAFKGRWSLPGGHIEAGETARAAAAREVREEAGVEADILHLVDVHDIVLRNLDGALAAHYLIAVYCGRWRAGEPAAASDAAAARFVPLGEIAAYPLTDGAAKLIQKAWSLMQTEAR